MEFQELIESRRSIRNYDAEKKIGQAEVEAMIRAAQEAPSWKNQQTSRYYVIQSEELLARFKAECLAPFNAKRSENAPVLIVTTFVKNCVGFNDDGVTPTNELGNGWGLYDLGLQSENLILKAKELGIDSLIMGIRDADKIRTTLNIPEEEVVVSVIAFGYAVEPAKRPARKELEEVAKFL